MSQSVRPLYVRCAEGLIVAERLGGTCVNNHWDEKNNYHNLK